jgi:uncharacterized protein involved in response to NO
MVPASPPLESWRLFFPAAAALAVGGLLAWGAQLFGMPLALTPSAHAAFMIWGVLGAGVQGFLFTAYAKQNDAPLPSRGLLFGVLAAQAVSAAVLLVGGFGLAAAAAVVLPWAGLLTWAVPVALVGAAVGVVLHALGTVAPRGIDVALHTFLVPIALGVLDRVLPFFSSRVTPGYSGRRLAWFLGPLLLMSWLKVLAPLTGGPAVARAATIGLVVVLLRQWWGWRPWPAARTPMVGILHVGIAWVLVGWGLEIAGAPRSASTHALLVGGLGTLFLGISLRVARGHRGLPIEAGRLGALVLGVGQLAALLRVGSALGAGSVGLLVVSAVTLAWAFGLWMLAVGPLALGRAQSTASAPVTKHA